MHPRFQKYPSSTLAVKYRHRLCKYGKSQNTSEIGLRGEQTSRESRKVLLLFRLLLL
jgi:hypothetical protein